MASDAAKRILLIKYYALLCFVYEFLLFLTFCFISEIYVLVKTLQYKHGTILKFV